MTTPENDAETTSKPAWVPLGTVERRVLGVLIEKAKTTPAGYPMSLNAIQAGSNQKSNRDPSMTLSTDDVEDALERLRAVDVVREATESIRVAKFRHRAYEWLGVSRAELAVMAELLLRGAQTLGDLRGRAARMEPIADLAALRPIVEGLTARGLMIELSPPGRGQLVSHGLYLEPELAELRARLGGRGAASPSRADGEGGGFGADYAGASRGTAADSRIDELSAAVEELREEVAGLRDQLRGLESRLAGSVASPPGSSTHR